MKQLLRMTIVSLITSLLGLLMSASAHTPVEIVRARIQLLNGSSIRGTISRIDTDGTVTGRNLPAGLIVDQIVSAQTKLAITRDSESQLDLQLVGGGILLARNPRISGETVTFTTLCGLKRVKLELVQSMIWVDSPRVREVVANPSPDNDRVVVQTESGIRVVEGLLESMTESHVILNYQGESRKISLQIVNAIVGADLGLSPPTGSLVAGSQSRTVWSRLPEANRVPS